MASQDLKVGVAEQRLIAAFVETFVKLDRDHVYTHRRPPLPEFRGEIATQDWNIILWQPAKVATDVSQLRSIEERLGRRLPKLYRYLVLNYRWPEVRLHRVRLYENQPGPDLSALEKMIFNDPVFVEELIGRGFVPFACGAEGDEHSYDPVCFDLRHLEQADNAQIIRLQHEAILSFGQLGRPKLFGHNLRPSWPIQWPRQADSKSTRPRPAVAS